MSENVSQIPKKESEKPNLRAILLGALVGFAGLTICGSIGYGLIITDHNNRLEDEINNLKGSLTPQVIPNQLMPGTPFTLTAEGTIMITPTNDFPVATLTPTPTNTETSTPTNYPTATSTFTHTPTETPMPTLTASPTQTATLTPTERIEPTPTNTVTSSETPEKPSLLEDAINFACNRLENQIVEIRKIAEWYSEPRNPRDAGADLDSIGNILCAIQASYRSNTSFILPYGTVSVAIQPGLNTADGTNGIFNWARENELFFVPRTNPQITSTPIDLSVAATDIANSSATPDTEKLLGVDSTPQPTTEPLTPTPIATGENYLIVREASVTDHGDIIFGRLVIPAENIITTITVNLDGNIEGASDAVYSLTVYTDENGDMQMHWGLPRSNARPQVQATATTEATLVDENTIFIPGTATSAPIPGPTSTATSVPIPTVAATATQVPPPGESDPTATSVGVPG